MNVTARTAIAFAAIVIGAFSLAACERLEAPAKWQAGEVFRDCPDCPKMVVVPAGSFTMGSPSSEEYRLDDEGPRHRVTISRPFAVGVHEVTVGEFARFVSATGHPMGNSCWLDPGFVQTDEHPVVCVSWEDAQAYVRWLSGKTGAEYRLLSEAEWEYAARAGTATAWHTGGTISTDQANFNDSHDGGHFEERTVPVGSFIANGFGLYNVHGNVVEWVEDCYQEDYVGAPDDGSAWERGYCSVRVVRGGSWADDPGLLRSAFRIWSKTGNRFSVIGFRVARTLAP